jgi:uncharacterized membrane protein YjfL (UPF0719 family)
VAVPAEGASEVHPGKSMRDPESDGTEANMEVVIGIGQAIAFSAIAFLWMWLAKLFTDVRMRSVYDADQQITEARNLAVGLRRAGMYLGVGIGMLGALSGGGGAFVPDATLMLVEGGVMVAFLFVAQRISDAVVVHGIANDEALRDGNVAVGLVELGISVATGLIAYGSFAGEGGGIVSAIVFFALGQLALLAMSLIYERITPYHVVDGVRGGNVAAGLMLGGMLLAFGFILQSSLAGPFVGWSEDLLGFGASAAMGIVLLLLLQWPIDRLFLPGTTLREEIETEPNPAAVAVAVAVKIALALVISAVLI